MHVVYKYAGETPLQCIQRMFDTEKNSYTYAGRLDPMAEGLLIVLGGDECKDAKRYHNLNKTYEYSFIVGVSTDTYDCLGNIMTVQYPEKEIDGLVQEAVKKITGKQTLPYPPYSSKTVSGVPLFEYARNNTLGTITLPTKTTHILQHKIAGMKMIEMEDLVHDVSEKIKKVRGDFRQEEILQKWNGVENHAVPHFFAEMTAGAGTYVRSIVHEIGNVIGYPTVTTGIKRTKVGIYTSTGFYGQ